MKAAGKMTMICELSIESLDCLRLFGLAFPDDNASPAEFAKRALMEFVAGSVAIQFREPPFAPVRRRRAVLATTMSMPKAAVDEDDGLVPGQNDVGANEARCREASDTWRFVST